MQKYGICCNDAFKSKRDTFAMQIPSVMKISLEFSFHASFYHVFKIPAPAFLANVIFAYNIVT